MERFQAETGRATTERSNGDVVYQRARRGREFACARTSHNGAGRVTAERAEPRGASPRRHPCQQNQVHRVAGHMQFLCLG